MKLLFSSLICLLFIMTSQSQDLDLELIASGFSNPLEIKHASDDRLFIVERGGLIKILNSDGSINTTPFLNISSLVTSGGERGLLGLAFHPNYTSNGFFYVYYINTSGNTQISRFTVSTNPDVADPSSEVQMLSFNQPATNHNGGHLAFGPDGKLFIASGDGGNAGESQNLSTYLGKILRLDVDVPAPYIPTDNPFISNSAALDEIWAFGLRNPWKFSFDSQTDDLWIADVGEYSWEEVNKEHSTTAGLNYGWSCYEGNSQTSTTNCPPIEELTFPIAVYANVPNVTCSITGGYVYRGAEFPAIQGLYFFADLCSDEIGTVDQNGNLTFHGTFGATFITSFGVDFDNNLYLATFNTGSIYKVIDNTLGLADNNENYFMIYPNPAKTEIQIKSANYTLNSFEVFDVRGRSLTSGSLQGNTTDIDVSQFKSGVYFVNVTTSQGTSQIKKLIKI